MPAFTGVNYTHKILFGILRGPRKKTKTKKTPANAGVFLYFFNSFIIWLIFRLIRSFQRGC